MAVVRDGYLRGKMRSDAFGEIVFQGRKGQQIVKSKPAPMHLKKLKEMTDRELAEWATKHGTTVEKAQKIKSKQEKIKTSVDECKRERAENPADFINKYKPRKEGETPFNVCVSVKQKS